MSIRCMQSLNSPNIILCMTRLSLLVLLLCELTVASAQDKPIITEENYEKFLEKSGDVIQVLLPVAGITTTIILDDRAGKNQFISSFFFNTISTHLLKEITAKKRPEDSTQKNSFPSGHTSSAFQGAAFIQRRYGWKYGWMAYAAAAFTGYSRIEGLNDRHDFIDVAGGAVLGVASTYIFTRKRTSPSVSVSGTFGKEFYSVSILVPIQK